MPKLRLLSITLFAVCSLLARSSTTISSTICSVNDPVVGFSQTIGGATVCSATVPAFQTAADANASVSASLFSVSASATGDAYDSASSTSSSSANVVVTQFKLLALRVRVSLGYRPLYMVPTFTTLPWPCPLSFPFLPPSSN